MNGIQKRERPEGSRANAEENAENKWIVGQPFADRKTVETLKARAALAGHEARVARYAGGRITLTLHRLGQSRVFKHLHDVKAFLTQLGDVR